MRIEALLDVPLDVPGSRAWLTAHAVPGVDCVAAGPDGGSVHARDVPTSVGACRLEVHLPVDGPASLRAAGVGADEAVAAGRRWLGLDLDVAASVTALAEDPLLGPLVRARPHLRVPGAPDAFEAAVGVVLGQHVSLAADRVFAGRLAAACAVRPEVLARVAPDALQAAVGVTSARARTVVFLPGDLVLRRALGGVSSRDAEATARAWAPHRSLAVVQLWTHHALDPAG